MTVHLRPVAQPRVGTTSTLFEITWLDASEPEGTVHDVQIERPGDSAFHPFLDGDGSGFVSFFPDAGPGVYRFRARLRRPSTGAHTWWSPAVSITVT
jgi:hypothetical protein